MRIKKQKTQKRCVIKRNKLISKNLKTERHNVFTEKNNKIALSSKNVMSCFSQTYVYGTIKHLLCKKEVSKCM